MGKKLYKQTMVEIISFDEQDVVRTSATTVASDGVNWEEYWSNY